LVVLIHCGEPREGGAVCTDAAEKKPAGRQVEWFEVIPISETDHQLIRRAPEAVHHAIRVGTAQVTGQKHVTIFHSWQAAEAALPDMVREHVDAEHPHLAIVRRTG
jgi:hypothetical protein